MRATRILSTLVLAVAGAIAAAQMPNTTPPEEITKLAYLVGEWEGGMKWTMEGAPPNMESKDTWKIEMEGQFLKMVSKTDMMGFQMAETSYLGWNAATKRYDCWAFSNMSPAPRLEHGTVDGDKWIMESEPWDTGNPAGPTTGRVTMTKKGDNEMQVTLEFKNGDKWDKIAEGSLKKKAPAGAKAA